MRKKLWQRVLAHCTNKRSRVASACNSGVPTGGPKTLQPCTSPHQRTQFLHVIFAFLDDVNGLSIPEGRRISMICSFRSCLTLLASLEAFCTARVTLFLLDCPPSSCPRRWLVIQCPDKKQQTTEALDFVQLAQHRPPVHHFNSSCHVHTCRQRVRGSCCTDFNPRMTVLSIDDHVLSSPPPCWTVGTHTLPPNDATQCLWQCPGRVRKTVIVAIMNNCVNSRGASPRAKSCAANCNNKSNSPSSKRARRMSWEQPPGSCHACRGHLKNTFPSVTEVQWLLVHEDQHLLKNRSDLPV